MIFLLVLLVLLLAWWLPWWLPFVSFFFLGGWISWRKSTRQLQARPSSLIQFQYSEKSQNLFLQWISIIALGYSLAVFLGMYFLDFQTAGQYTKRLTVLLSLPHRGLFFGLLPTVSGVLAALSFSLGWALGSRPPEKPTTAHG